MKHLTTFIKGIIIGFISCAIPGLSALTFAVVLCVYFPLVDALSNIFKNFKKSILFIIFFFTGYVIGAILAATIVSTVYERYPLIIVCIILGFILGSLPKLIKDVIPYIKKITGWIVFILIVVAFFVFQTLVPVDKTYDLTNINFLGYLVIFFVGLICSISFAFPGFDYKILLLAMGFYYPVMSSIKNVTMGINSSSNLLFLGCYVAGYMLGIFILSRFIKLLNIKFPGQVKFAILSLVLVSPYMVIKNCVIDNVNFGYNNTHLIIGIVLGVISVVAMFLINFLHNPNIEPIESANNRNVYKFFINRIFNVFSRKKYFKRVKKALKANPPFEERYSLVQDIFHSFNEKANIKPKITGSENINGDVSLYVVNHQGKYDSFAVMTALYNNPSKLVVKDKYFYYPYSKDILKLLECISLDDEEAYQKIDDALKNNINVIVFIQKGLIQANTLKYFTPSILDTAYLSKAKITPVLLYDSYLVYTKTDKEIVEPEIHFLKPITYEEYKDISRDELSKIIKQEMSIKMQEIKNIKDLNNQG